MSDSELKAALKECKKSATAGYKIASSQYKELNSTIQEAREQVRNAVFEFESSPCYISDTTEMLSHQLLDIEDSFTQLSFFLKEDIENLKEHLSDFSTTLFGRTMAGKSTLMEILTHGSGNSIGNGSQRTTKDVREYEWEKLKITDVPGISAFEGEDDEKIAFNAAKSADLILFLITDDAPQAAEAECFSQIMRLGKPVICIMNVKAAVDENSNIKLAIRDIERKFDINRLNSIRDQFIKYAEQTGQTWNYVPFIYVHLKSAFLSTQIKDKEKSLAYYQVSQIEKLENQIIKQVREKGKYFRIKNFIDIISVPMLDSMERLINQSVTNSSQGRTILSKRRQLITWEEGFERESKTRINSLVKNIESSLYFEIATFSEEHFDDKNADKAWNKVLKEKRIEEKCQILLEDFENQCNSKIEEISREIVNELKFSNSFSNDHLLKMNSIINTKKIWGWSSTIISGSLSIGALVTYVIGGAAAAASGPLGWAALAVGVIGAIGGFLFRSKDQKESDARKKLEINLKKNVSDICKNLKEQLLTCLNKIISTKISNVIKELTRMNTVVFKLADTQKDLSWNLNRCLLEMNRQLIIESLNMYGEIQQDYSDIVSVARIPGGSILMAVKEDGNLSDDKIEFLKKLISEHVRLVRFSQNKWFFISRIMGKSCDRNNIRIEDKIGVVHILLEEDSPIISNKLRMVQQLSEYVVLTK